MKRFFTVLIVVLVSTSVFGGDASSEYTRKTLSNGLEVVVIENHLVPIATIEIVTRNGSMCEPPEYNGLSHLYEHMFFKANAALPSQEQYLERIHELGIQFNGSTHEEFVNYFVTLPVVNFNAGMKFMADAIMTPKFDQQELERERQVVIGEFDRDEAQPIFPLQRLMDSTVWWKYPSRKQPLGVRPMILSATREQMLTIQHRYYIPNNSMLVVGGDVTPAEVFAEAEKVLGAWKRGPDPFKEFPVQEEAPIEKSQIVKVPLSIPIAVVEETWDGPSVGKDNAATYAADVFSYILSQPTSKFQKALVETGLAQSMNIGYETQAHTGPITIFGTVLPNTLAKSLEVVHGEIAKWDGDDYFTDDELQTAKHILKV